MCDPVSLSVAALAVSAGSTIVAHQEQAKAFEANAKAANTAFQTDASQLNTRLSQEEQAAAQTKLNKTMEGRAALGKNIASQGEAGISLNYDSIAADIVRNVSFSNTATDANLAMTKASLQDELRGASNRRTSRINEVAAPSALASGLKIAGSTLQGASDITAASNATKTTPTPVKR